MLTLDVSFVFKQGLDLPEILVEVERRGSSFAELLTVPEQDDWVYADGKSTSCVAFVLEMYKEAGLFGPLASSIEVTEFTVSLSNWLDVFCIAMNHCYELMKSHTSMKVQIKDAYSLNFFENDTSHLPKWCNEGDTVELPFCQIRGKYRMELPEYNTMEPYAHMNERCPSMPPEYYRPEGC